MLFGYQHTSFHKYLHLCLVEETHTGFESEKTFIFGSTVSVNNEMWHYVHYNILHVQIVILKCSKCPKKALSLSKRASRDEYSDSGSVYRTVLITVFY